MNYKNTGLLILVIFICAAFTYGCDKPSLSDPVAAMKTFQAAVAKKDWLTAQICLCDEIIQYNQQGIASGEIYFIDYWVDSRTIQNAFSKYPVIDRFARFSVVSVTGDNARLLVEYTNPMDKDIRLMMITLKRDSIDQWKIAEFYGFNRGSAQRK